MYHKKKFNLKIIGAEFKKNFLKFFQIKFYFVFTQNFININSG